jgi:hypothetical protein
VLAGRAVWSGPWRCPRNFSHSGRQQWQQAPDSASHMQAARRSGWIWNGFHCLLCMFVCSFPVFLPWVRGDCASITCEPAARLQPPGLLLPAVYLRVDAWKQARRGYSGSRWQPSMPRPPQSRRGVSCISTASAGPPEALGRSTLTAMGSCVPSACCPQSRSPVL